MPGSHFVLWHPLLTGPWHPCRYHDHWRAALNSLSFMGAFIHYLETGNLITRSELAKMLNSEWCGCVYCFGFSHWDHFPAYLCQCVHAQHLHCLLQARWPLRVYVTMVKLISSLLSAVHTGRRDAKNNHTLMQLQHFLLRKCWEKNTTSFHSLKSGDGNSQNVVNK